MEQWRHRPTDRGDTAATTGSGEQVRQRRVIPKLEGATELFPAAQPGIVFLFLFFLFFFVSPLFHTSKFKSLFRFKLVTTFVLRLHDP
jgi:hypothetical protein